MEKRVTGGAARPGKLPSIQPGPAGAPGTAEVAVCVVGAGPVGATLAATLAAGGVPTAVIDHQPLPPMELPAFDGRAYAIALTSQRLLAASGVWDRLPVAPGPIRQIRVADGRPGEPASPLSLHFAHDSVGEAGPDPDEAAPFGWMVEARSLRVALNARMPELPTLRVLAPASAVAVERGANGATLRLADGGTLRARLVVSAEGRNSRLRREAGIAAARYDYRQIALVGSVAHEKPHNETALEQFLPNGPFAQLPLARPVGAPGWPADLPFASAIVWSDRRAIGERMLRLPDADYAREIARRMGGHLGRVWPVGQRWSYPLTAMHAARFTAERLALVGDAAHGIHPIAGQGLNLGFRDVAALAELVIAAHNAGADVGSAALLRRYQAMRRPDSLVMLGATHALERLFGNDLPPVRLARDIGIAAVDRIPPLKRWFARRAMGLGPNLPGLLAGRGL